MSVPAPKKQGKGLQRDVPQGVTIAALALVVIALGAGAFYIMNDGFETQAQKTYQWVHVGYPLKMARKGDLTDLINENNLRKATGQPLLAIPPITVVHNSRADLKACAAELRAAMRKHRASAGALSPM